MLFRSVRVRPETLRAHEESSTGEGGQEDSQEGGHHAPEHHGACVPQDVRDLAVPQDQEHPDGQQACRARKYGHDRQVLFNR